MTYGTRVFFQINTLIDKNVDYSIQDIIHPHIAMLDDEGLCLSKAFEGTKSRLNEQLSNWFVIDILSDANGIDEQKKAQADIDAKLKRLPFIGTSIIGKDQFLDYVKNLTDIILQDGKIH